MNRKYMSAVMVATLVGVFAVGAFAQSGIRRAKAFGAGHGFGQRMAQQLGLTDQQKTQIQQILQNEKPAIQPLRQQLKAARQQMNAATANGQFDEAQVRNIATSESQAMTSLLVERQRVKAEIWKVLTPDQRTKADQLKQQFAQRRHSRRNPQAQPQQ